MANDNIAVQKLKLGIGLPNSGSMYVYAKQYDGNSRKIVAEILDSDGPVSLAGNSVRLNATLPNGNKLYMEGQVEDNKATFILTADFLALDGTVACDISVINDTGDGLLLTSSTFYIVVSQSNFDENAPGSFPSSVVVSTMLKPDTAVVGHMAVFDANRNVVDGGAAVTEEYVDENCVKKNYGLIRTHEDGRTSSTAAMTLKIDDADITELSDGMMFVLQLDYAIASSPTITLKTANDVVLCSDVPIYRDGTVRLSAFYSANGVIIFRYCTNRPTTSVPEAFYVLDDRSTDATAKDVFATPWKASPNGSVYYATLVAEDANAPGTFISLVTSNETGTTKRNITTPLIPKKLYIQNFKNETVAPGTASSNNLYYMAASVDPRRLVNYNAAGHTTDYQTLYLKGTLDSSGNFIMGDGVASTTGWWSIGTPSSSETGYVFWRVGRYGTSVSVGFTLDMCNSMFKWIDGVFTEIDPFAQTVCKNYVDERVVANDNTGTSGGYLSTIKIGGVSYTIGTLPCLIEGTKILMADDTEKNIEDVTSGDLIKSYNPTTQEITDAVVIGCYKTGEEHQFNHFTYSNGKSLTVFGVHGYYSPDSGVIKDISTSKFGTKVLDMSLEECVLIDRRPIGKYGKAKSRYNLISSNNLYFANGILLGGRPVHKYHYCLRTNEKIPSEIETVLSQDCEDYNDFISVIDNPRFILEAKDAFIASSQAYNVVKADKERLEKTDYKTLKHTEGKISDEEYAEALKERDALRQEINEQQEIYLTNLRVIKRLKTQYRNGETERSLFEKCCDRDNAAIDQFRAWLTPIKEETNDEAE